MEKLILIFNKYDPFDLIHGAGAPPDEYSFELQRFILNLDIENLEYIQFKSELMYQFKEFLDMKLEDSEKLELATKEMFFYTKEHKEELSEELKLLKSIKKSFNNKNPFEKRVSTKR